MDTEPTGELQNPTTIAMKALSDIGCEVIPPSKYNLPADYNTSRFKQDQKLVDRTIQILTGYLNYPIIKDGFGGHEDRTKWRMETGQMLAEKYGPEARGEFERILQENKMKRGSVQKVIGFIDLLSEYLPRKLAHQILFMENRVKPGPKAKLQWNGPTTPEKIEIVNRFSDNIVKALHHLAGTRSPSGSS